MSKLSSCAAAHYAEDRSTSRYRQRAVAYLDVVTAQLAALQRITPANSAIER
ncbi:MULTISPECIES: hypothetical protein [Pseudomonas]|uniref:hypothetical protein n=1 Tax=Pseudomonas TaxID=286 RepID=UPI001F59E84C|nr:MULTISPECIES: hypothetical protein [unclassified Pseudomonas]